LFLLVVCSGILPAQPERYSTSWDSLDQRPTPQWWKDAKFGVFVFWGPASVPAFSPRGEYSEWYWYWVENAETRGPACRDFHNKVYGEDFEYADFLPLFKGELFDPEEWASLIERSGAKYVVLNSKHHDGYTMWPSQEANQSWGRKWNSLETGPRRDVLGEVAEAVRKIGLRFGVYYSLYEWFNPLYVSDVNLFVEKLYIPQFKDLVTRYEPEVIFADGEWEHGNEVWRSNELLAWLFNESPARESVVVNDRWFKGSRHKHGGYYTTEYGSGLEGATHPWEENRAIGKSYGFNRAEVAEDYSSSQELVLMLVDIVSRGGNLLLDVGPAADGSIPVIMQDRLLEMGRWLETNGDAIYGTTAWKRGCQWSKGTVVKEERGEFRTGYDILRLTLDPREGDAVKEIFFTRKEDTLFAITPRLPAHELVVRDLKLEENSEISLLGYAESLTWRQEGGDVVIEMPRVRESQLTSDLAFAFRLVTVSE
jgi:alpha-L-fucosidase